MDKTYQEQLGDSSVTWSAVSLTHVEYVKGDTVGHLLAWSSLFPIFLIVAFTTLIIFRRDLHTMSFFAGLVIDEALNWTLKHTIKEPRPIRDRKNLYTEYGMPSSHAQFTWFFSAYLVLFLFIRVHHSVNLVDNLWKYCSAFGALAASSIVCHSRIYLGYHTQTQVWYGAAVGVLAGVTWFCVVHNVLTPLFPTITSWRISEYLMIRDSTLIPHVLWFEYTSHRNEVRTRMRKKSLRNSS